MEFATRSSRGHRAQPGYPEAGIASLISWGLALGCAVAACAGDIAPGERGDDPGATPGNPGTPGRTGAPLSPGTPGSSGTGGSTATPGTPGMPGPSTPGAPTSPGGACAESPGAATLRRLGQEELERSLKALLGRDVDVAWPQDELVSGYASARDNLIHEPHARALYTSLLPELRKIVTTGLAGLSDKCATADAACAASLVDGFAARAFRRAVTAAERTSLLAFYDQARQDLGDPKEATAHLLLAVLSSPHFLYRSELGVADAGRPERRLSSREIGTALAYFFWGQPPDATLLAKMDGDRLQADTDINAEIERLRAAPAHAAWMGRFFQQWSHVQGLDQKDHAADKYPDATKAYKREAELALVQQFTSLITKPTATYEELIASRSLVAGPLTAKAVKAGAKPTALSSVEADPGRRGVFMSVGFLTEYSKPDRPSALGRAKFFLDQVICRDLPGVPADALQREFTPDPKKTHRQNFEAFTSGVACAACHTMLNPIGFSFDRFGADGQVLREIDGFPINTRGTIKGAGELDGDIEGPEDFILKVSKSRDARLCYLRQLFRFGTGRKDAELDRCTLERVLGTMQKEGDLLSSFARNYFTSRGFLSRQIRETP